MSVLHDMVYAAAALVTSPVWGYRLLHTGKWRTDWQGRFGHASPPSQTAENVKTILFHAVSVGEVNAIRELVEQLAKSGSQQFRLIIAVTTDTGFARACELFPLIIRWFVIRWIFHHQSTVSLMWLKPDL
ncbi:MAG: hypothetical protein HC898_12470 [Phycisphaerales bacterium]|nr:hypothetical protein [Phycisphaerales bacterium]